MKGDHWPTVSPSLNALRNQCIFITVCAVRLVEVEKPNTLFVKAGIKNNNNNNNKKMLDEAIISSYI